MADAESNLVPSEAADQVEVALEEQAAADDGILYLLSLIHISGARQVQDLYHRRGPHAHDGGVQRAAQDA